MSSSAVAVMPSVRCANGQKDIWTRIGAAWPHGGGTGFNIQLEALPMGDRIVLTEPKADEPKPDEAEVPAEAA
jgi:hypothetical protein